MSLNKRRIMAWNGRAIRFASNRYRFKPRMETPRVRHWAEAEMRHGGEFTRHHTKEAG